jgi:hypothetical protein
MGITKNPSEITIIDGNVDIMLGRLTSTRAGYMDNLTNLDDTITNVNTAINAASTTTANAVTAANNASDVASTAALNAANALTAANSASSNGNLTNTNITNACNIGASASSAANLARACAVLVGTDADISSRTLMLHNSQWIQSGCLQCLLPGGAAKWAWACGCKGTL